MNLSPLPNSTGSTVPPPKGESVEPVVRLPQILLRRRWWIITSVMFCLSLGVGYCLVVGKEYTGVTRLHVTKHALFTESQVLVSEPVLQEALTHSELRPVLALKRGEDAVGALSKRLEVEVDEARQILTLSACDAQAGVSAQLVNAVAEGYVRYHAAKNRSSWEQAFSLLREQQGEKDSDLKKKQAALESFQRETDVLDFEAPDPDSEAKHLEKLAQVVTEAQLNALEAKADYDSDLDILNDQSDPMIQLERLIESQRSRGIPAPLVAAQNNELRMLEFRLANLREQFTDESPAVKSLNQRIEELRIQIIDEQAQVMGHLIAAMGKNLQATQSKMVEARQSFQAHQKGVELTRDRFNTLRSAVDEAERLVALYEEKARALSVAEGAEALGIELLSVASVPEKPTKDPVKRILAMSLVVGLSLGSLLAFWKESRDPRLCSVEQNVEAPVELMRRAA